MIIWIDGVLGIGKSTTAQNLWARHFRSNGELLDSDECFIKLSNEDPWLPFESFFPNDNPRFLQKFRSVIEQKLSSSNKDLIMAIALIRQEGKKHLFNPLMGQDIPILHFILTANRDDIVSRIKGDSERDQMTALSTLDDSIRFLKENFRDAIWIDTENKSADRIADQLYCVYQKFKNALPDKKFE